MSGLIGLACATALMVSACTAASPPDAGAPSRATVEYECVLQSDGGEVVLGETISVTRGPDGECEGLDLGSTQSFELRSSYAADEVKATVEVAVSEDGAFSFEVQVPDELRLARAVLQALPADPGCDDPSVLDCPAPTVSFDVVHPASALRNAVVVSKALATPALPAEPLESHVHGFYQLGPADDELTLVIPGSGCETLPRFYVATAPSNSLEFVTEEVGDICTDMAVQWTTVVHVPEEYAGFNSVKIDNVPAELLPAE
jgi:hypothetical protein